METKIYQGVTLHHPVFLKWPRRVRNLKRYSDLWNYWDDVVEWTILNFGNPGGSYTITSTINDMVIDFNDEKDQIAFILRWGNDGF